MVNPAIYVRTKADIVNERKGSLFWVVVFVGCSIYFPEYAFISQLLAGYFAYSFLNTIIPLTQILFVLFLLWIFTDVFN
ncbi:MAG: hypothetical protein CMK59_12970 [Proteobacteria bacterium]|nr:hypothetical protein [Pseudomonadota bacterium]